LAVSRLGTILKALEQFYGALPAPPRDPFTLFVWEVLSVHSTPRKRDAALAALKRIPAMTPDSMWRAPAKKLEEAAKAAGPYVENRLQALRSGSEIFRRAPNLPNIIRGPLPAILTERVPSGMELGHQPLLVPLVVGQRLAGPL